MLLRKARSQHLLIVLFLLARTISAPVPSNLQSLLMAQVVSSIVAVTSIDDQDGLRIHDHTRFHSGISRIEPHRYYNKTKSTDPDGGTVTDSGVAVTSINNQDGILIDYYRQYNGNGSTEGGWPAKDKWISFMDMFNNSRWHMEKSCRQFNVDLNTHQEIVDMYEAIQFVAAATFVDHRFILAIVMQESGGCVRAPTSNYGVPNPGLMQDHNGTASCNNGTTVQKPCPGETITQMIQEGTGGTTWGDGLAQCLNSAGTSDVSAFYKAARIYNSGSIDDSGDLGKGIATHCYASDIANRLTGFIALVFIKLFLLKLDTTSLMHLSRLLPRGLVQRTSINCLPKVRILRPFTSTRVLAIDMDTVNTTERLKSLRHLMSENKIDVYIVPSEDSHQSEYIAPCDARREHICGFSGSAGTAVITHDKAALATDGRYFNQASKQLDSNWELLKQGLEEVPTWQEWTADQSDGNKTVGVDPTVITAPDARKLAEKIKKKGGAGLVGVKTNLVDRIWGDSRPSRPKEKIRTLPLEFTGKKFEEKIEDLRKELEKKKSAGLIVSMLDEVAWLYNLRGNDIPYNPVFFSYAIITPATATIYVDSNKFSSDVEFHLGDKVQVRPYDAILDDTKMLSLKPDIEQELETNVAGKQSVEPKRKFMISTKASWALSLELGGEDKVEELRSPVGDAKAIKNKTELEGMRACHVRDGAALCEYFAWLEKELVGKATVLDEVQAADKLESIRATKHNFAGLSFDTISSTGANAAVIHYKPEPGSCSVIDPKAIYLCDSGAQYLDGTTDTTRTLHFGTPSDMERKSYTLVLKGVIALDTAVFPKGTSGFALDTLARQFLWEEGLDYRHGTGHGVGSYLNVHEGPIGIGTRVAYSEVALSAGNVLSDEPGYYEDGNFGIRIENIIMAKEVETRHRFGDKPYLGFEHVTMVPMCRKLIDVGLLSGKERMWVDAYHKEVMEKTKGFFEGDERTMKWLERETAEL